MQNPTKDNLKNGSFVLVKYVSKKTTSHFIGVIDNDELTDENTMCIKYLVKQPSKTGFLSFVFPVEDDSDNVEISNILLVLPSPTSTGGTNRLALRYVFNGVDLSGYSF